MREEGGKRTSRSSLCTAVPFGVLARVIYEDGEGGRVYLGDEGDRDIGGGYYCAIFGSAGLPGCAQGWGRRT